MGQAPCKHCPFRSDVDFYVRPGRRKEIDDAIARDQMFYCHKTTGGEEKDWRPCVGSAIYLEQNYRGGMQSNLMYRLAIGCNLLPLPSELDETVNIRSRDSFVD